MLIRTVTGEASTRSGTVATVIVDWACVLPDRVDDGVSENAVHDWLQQKLQRGVVERNRRVIGPDIDSQSGKVVILTMNPSPRCRRLGNPPSAQRRLHPASEKVRVNGAAIDAKPPHSDFTVRCDPDSEVPTILTHDVDDISRPR